MGSVLEGLEMDKNQLETIILNMNSLISKLSEATVLILQQTAPELHDKAEAILRAQESLTVMLRSLGSN